ncbi:unnamed protein product, partial [Mesorhabditis spiculigera]
MLISTDPPRPPRETVTSRKFGLAAIKLYPQQDIYVIGDDRLIMSKEEEEEFLENEPFRDDDGTYTELNRMTFHGSAFGRQDSLSIAAELQQKDKERNQSSFMEADVNIENYLKELRDEEAYTDDPLQEDPELAKTSFEMEQSAVFDSIHNNPMMGRLRDDPMDDIFKSQVPHSSHQQGPLIDTAPITLAKMEPWEEEQGTSRQPRTVMVPRTQIVQKYPVMTEPSKPPMNKNYVPTTKARKYNLKPKEEKETNNYKIKRMRNNDAVRRSRMKAKEAQEKREKELSDLRSHNDKLERENKLLINSLQEYRRKCTCQPFKH